MSRYLTWSVHARHVLNKLRSAQQTEREAMVLDSPKFYNYEYFSDFSQQSYVMKIEVSSVLYSFNVSLCDI